MLRLVRPAFGGLAVAAFSLAPGKPRAACHGKGSGHGSNSSLPDKWRHAHEGPRPHLLFGVPKKGRLHDRIMQTLKGSGIEFTRKDRLDIAHCANLPVSIVFLPAADIATYVGEGEVDLGITGEDIVAESQVEVETLMKLGLGKCELCVQAPQGKYAGAHELAGKRIVTSFPNLAKKYFGQFETFGKPTKIKCISGSVEASIGLGLADGIVDLVETGTTMRAAGLEAVSVVMETQTVLICNPQTSQRELVEVLRKRIAGYMTANRYVMVAYNCREADLPRVTQITPGKRSPTISPLTSDDGERWFAVQALVPKKEAASTMDALEQVGATDILLTALLSTRTVNSVDNHGHVI